MFSVCFSADNKSLQLTMNTDIQIGILCKGIQTMPRTTRGCPRPGNERLFILCVTTQSYSRLQRRVLFPPYDDDEVLNNLSAAAAAALVIPGCRDLSILEQHTHTSTGAWRGGGGSHMLAPADGEPRGLVMG